MKVFNICFYGAVELFFVNFETSLVPQSCIDVVIRSQVIDKFGPSEIAKSREIPTKFDITAVQGHPDWLSMVLRLHQHNIGYTADGFYRSDDLTNSVKALKEGG